MVGPQGRSVLACSRRSRYSIRTAWVYICRRSICVRRVRESERERERDDHVPSSSLSIVEPDNELEEGTGDSRVFLSGGDVCACVGTPGIINATVDVV